MPAQKAILRDILKHGLDPQKKYTKVSKVGELTEKEKLKFAPKTPTKEEKQEVPVAIEEPLALEKEVQVLEEKIQPQEEVIIEKPKKKGFQKKQASKDN